MMIEIKNSPLSNGDYTRGVFATENIKKGTLLHKLCNFGGGQIDQIYV